MKQFTAIIFDLDGVTINTEPLPDPEPYLAAVSKLDVAPDSCLVVEDSTHGVASAKAAACTVVAIATSFTAEELAKASPRNIVTSYEELTSLLGI